MAKKSPQVAVPSSILRAPDDDSRREEMRAFVADLANVAEKIGPLRPE